MKPPTYTYPTDVRALIVEALEAAEAMHPTFGALETKRARSLATIALEAMDSHEWSETA